MSDLISRQAAIDAIERNAYRHTYIDQIVDIIKELPSAQPQITHCAECIHWKHSDVRKNFVRCKDCKYHSHDAEYGRDWCNRTSGVFRVKPDDFCSYGKRRTDEQTD